MLDFDQVDKVATCTRCQAPLRGFDRCPACGAAAAAAVLEVVRGLSQGASFEVAPAGCVIGRDRECDVVLRDPSISRRHARLSWQSGGFAIEDLGSTHGVFVGPDRVKSAPVPFGAFLRLGGVVARLVDAGQDATTSDLDLGPLLFLPGEAALAAVDRLDFGVFLVDSAGHVVSCNRSARALLDAGDGLGLRRQRLHADDPATQRVLERLLAGEAGEAGGALAVPRRPPLRPLSVLVSAVGLVSGVPAGASLLFVTDPDRRGEVPEKVLAGLYGLTGAEGRIAHLLTRGLSPSEVASTEGVSVSTVRSHLKRVFEKTGTHRQGELIQLLLSGLAPLNSAPAANPSRKRPSQN